MATPHFTADMDKDIFAKWNEAYRATRRIARRIDPKFRVYPGAEIYYDSRIPQLLKRGYPITLNKTNYVLVEFPIDIDMTYLADALFNLQVAGYHPIVAHIERYQVLQNIRNIKKLVNRGIRLQVNASTILGKSGNKLKKHVLSLAKEGYIDLVGTDAHGTKVRRPQIKEAIDILDQRIGPSNRELLCRRHFYEIARGEY
jgi:protein-tyrosine phosphatase